MTVYVDELRTIRPADSTPQAQRNGNRWCHLGKDGVPPEVMNTELAYLVPRMLAKRTIEPECGCWFWDGSRKSSGDYGEIRIKGKLFGVHRVAAAIWLGTDLHDREVFACHHCDTPHCFNPWHLFPGTHLENQQDKVAKGRGVRGEAANRGHLTAAVVREIRELRAKGVGCRVLGRRFNVSHGHISRITRGQRWPST